MVISFEVKTHPQFTVEQLAIQLGESLQGSFDEQKNADEFLRQKVVENQKIVDLNKIILEVENYRMNPPAKISRMDPLNTYELDDLKNEVAKAKERLLDWTLRNNDAIEKSTSLQKRSMELQQEIAKRNVRG